MISTVIAIILIMKVNIQIITIIAAEILVEIIKINTKIQKDFSKIKQKRHQYLVIQIILINRKIIIIMIKNTIIIIIIQLITRKILKKTIILIIYLNNYLLLLELLFKLFLLSYN